MQVATPSAGCDFDGVRTVVRPWGWLPPGLWGHAVRVLILSLLLILGWLQYRLWVGEGSLAEVHALKSDIAEQTQEIAALHARNQALAAEVANLKEGNQALEERARMGLGMIKQGEVFLQVIEAPPAAGDAGPKP